MKTVSLHLAKQNFKFSSAHFLIFDHQTAEMLHGHNYQVKVDIVCPSTDEVKEGSSNQLIDKNGKVGYIIDFNVLKKYIKSKLDLWDEHVLLPKLHPDMKFKDSTDQKNYEINFRDRFYSLPKNEVMWLNISNTSVEQLSSLLAEDFYQEFRKYGIEKVTVFVEETRGQSASTSID